MLLARGTCSHKLVIRVDLLYSVQIVIVEPELGDFSSGSRNTESTRSKERCKVRESSRRAGVRVCVRLCLGERLCPSQPAV